MVMGNDPLGKPSCLRVFSLSSNGHLSPRRATHRSPSYCFHSLLPYALSSPVCDHSMFASFFFSAFQRKGKLFVFHHPMVYHAKNWPDRCYFRSVHSKQCITFTSINNINKTTTFIQRLINITLILLISVIVSERFCLR